MAEQADRRDSCHVRLAQHSLVCVTRKNCAHVPADSRTRNLQLARLCPEGVLHAKRIHTSVVV